MNQARVQFETVLEPLQCCKCGTPFAISEFLKTNLIRTKETFYCPLGHGQSYTQSEADRLRAKLDEQTRAATNMAERAARAEASEQKALTELRRMKKRAAAGVCPCCNRSFVALARHIKTKHPEMVK